MNKVLKNVIKKANSLHLCLQMMVLVESFVQTYLCCDMKKFRVRQLGIVGTIYFLGKQSYFYVYCKSCKRLTRGKLRCRCASCKEGSFVLMQVIFRICLPVNKISINFSHRFTRYFSCIVWTMSFFS